MSGRQPFVNSYFAKTRLRSYKELSISLDTHLASRRPIRTRARHMSFEPFGATSDADELSEHGDGAGKGGMISICMIALQGRSEKQGYREGCTGISSACILYSALCDLYD